VRWPPIRIAAAAGTLAVTASGITLMGRRLGLLGAGLRPPDPGLDRLFKR